MTRRLSRPVAAALLALTLSLSVPAAFAAPSRDGGWEPSYATRILRIIKTLTQHFGICTHDSLPGVPIP
jgi:hypothetical protein